MRFVPDIAFELTPSRRLTAATVVLATVALGAIATSGAPSIVKLGFVLLVLVIAATAIIPSRRHRGRLAWLGDGRWRWKRDGVETFPVLRSARVLGPLLVLRFDTPRSVVLLPDNLDRETARRLRARLSARPSV